MFLRIQLTGIVCALLLGAGAATAVDGVREINQTCAAGAGCFPGDGAGFPVEVTSGGSYTLTSDLTGGAAGGILILAAEVTLDLNGFSLVGDGGSFGDGIEVVLDLANIEISNGVIRNWGRQGIDAGGAEVTVSNVRVSGNMSGGMALGFGRVADSTANDNGGIGIQFSGQGFCSKCIARRNASAGIRLSNGPGIVEESVAESNAANGIQIGNGGLVIDSVSRLNGGSGIFGSNAASVIGCVVQSNTRNGIALSGNSLILNNTASGNGAGAGSGAGIVVTSSRNRIEGNNVTVNDRGIETFFGGNIILKNTARGNGLNYDLAAGNSFGPIVNVAGVGDISAVVNADHPWANFSF